MSHCEGDGVPVGLQAYVHEPIRCELVLRPQSTGMVVLFFIANVFFFSFFSSIFFQK